MVLDLGTIGPQQDGGLGDGERNADSNAGSQNKNRNQQSESPTQGQLGGREQRWGLTAFSFAALSLSCGSARGCLVVHLRTICFQVLGVHQLVSVSCGSFHTLGVGLQGVGIPWLLNK